MVKGPFATFLLLLVAIIPPNFLTIGDLCAAQNPVPVLKRVTEEKDPAKRIEILDEALQAEGLTDQTLASLYFERAVALKEIREYFRALEDLDTAMGHSRRLTKALLEKAECLIKVDQLDEALLALEKFLLLRPGTARAHTLMGMIYEKQGGGLKAEDEYTRALKYDPSYTPAYDARAKILLKQGKPRKALQDLDTMLGLAPNNPDILIFRAAIYSKIRDYKSALADYTRAISLRPNDQEIRKNVVITYLMLDKPSKALEMLARYPGGSDDLEPALLTARAYILSNDLKKADAILAQIRNKWPNNAECRLLEGVICSQRSQPDEALSYLNAAIELDPKFVEAYKERAKTFVKIKEYVRAVNDLTTAAQLDPADGEIFCLRGEVQYQRWMFDAATSDFSKAMETMSDDPRVIYGLGLVHIRQGDFQSAFTDMDQVCKMKPDSARAVSMRGVVRYFLEDPEQSIVDLEKSVSMDPGDPLVLNNRGFFYLKAGNYTAAKSDFEKALTIDPCFLDAEQNLKLVESRRLQEKLLEGSAYADKGEK